MKKITKNLRRGVTSIEVLLASGIAGVLVSGTLVILEPQKIIEESRNARRWTDVTSLSEALRHYKIDQQTFPPNIPFEPTEVCRSH
jgi:hypothetical protein